jgi:hypothetical protein
MTKRLTRDVIASFPAFVAVDADGLHLATRFVVIEPGTKGYIPLPHVESLEQADRIAERWGADRLPSALEREAAQIGSMFGWDVPGADPQHPLHGSYAINDGGAA